MTESISKLKSFQYILVCRAGLAVCDQGEAPKENLHRDMLYQFQEAVKALGAMPPELTCYTKEFLLRSKNYTARVNRDEDLHTGTTSQDQIDVQTSDHALVSNAFNAFHELRFFQIC